MRWGRLALLVLALVLVAASLAANAAGGVQSWRWLLLGVAFLAAIVAQLRLPLAGSAPAPPGLPTTRNRRVAGLLLALAGIALWTWAVYALATNWRAHFNWGWLAWLAGACALSVGLDLATARWPRSTASGVVALWIWMIAIVALALATRFGTFVVFPAESHITQVEELQVGGMGSAYLNGWRERWEYLSHAWLGGLGIHLGGPNLMAMRAPFTLLSALKIVPLFLWLRFAVGTPGAVVGSILLAVSAWDVTLARVPTNQNTLVSALVFALLAGPAARARPSAFVWLGLSAGYVMYEYVVYRALAVYAIVGAVFVSLRDRAASLFARFWRPALTVVLFLSMTIPLVAVLQRSGLSYQYFDGWGRAKAQGQYYDPNATWATATQRRVERSLRAVGLFYFNGDESPARNPEALPMTDPVTGALLLLGVAYGLANPFRNLGGLAVFALLTTLAGTLVLTGNFDPVRAGGSVAFFYGLVGYGAAAFIEICAAAMGRLGRRLAYVLLAVALIGGAAHNARFLWNFSNAPIIRKNQFRELAYLSDWLGKHTGEGDYIIAVAPGNTFLFEINDATWMRGQQAKGAATWDVAGALGKLAERKAPTTFFVYAGPGTHAVRRYLQQLLPEQTFLVYPGPDAEGRDIVAGEIEALPADWAARLDAASCRFAEAKFEIFTGGEQPEAVVDTRVPFIDNSTFPQAVQSTIYKVQDALKRVNATFFGRFEVHQPGTYVFDVEVNPGVAEVFVDGEKVAPNRAQVKLEPGMHRLEVRAVYQPGGFPGARVFWEGPDTGGGREILPFHLLGSCEPPGAGA